jgi:hypothetical protein
MAGIKFVSYFNEIWLEISGSICFLAVQTAGKRTDSNRICVEIGFESLQTANVNKALFTLADHENPFKYAVYRLLIS